MIRAVYSAVICILAPVVHTAMRLFRTSPINHRDSLRRRFGFDLPSLDRPVIWLHAVSIGEVSGAAVLARELGRRYTDAQLVISTMTLEGADAIEALLGSGVLRLFVPFDTPGAMRRFLRKLKPFVAIVVESEVWPNLFAECARAKIPLVLANARVSERALQRYLKLPNLFLRPLHAAAPLVLAQSQLDRERFIAIGIDERRIAVVGNIKFDATPAESLVSAARMIREAHFGRRFVWVAGSTHAGEEEIVLQAHRELLKAHPTAVLVLARRRPESFGTVVRWLDGQAVSVARWSRREPVLDTHQVVLLDTLGELVKYYAVGNAAFVGGTLVSVGGHNVLEPALMARPVLFGPHCENVLDAARALIQGAGAIQVDSSAALANVLIRLAADAEEAVQMGYRAQLVAAKGAGKGAVAVDRICAALGENTAAIDRTVASMSS